MTLNIQQLIQINSGLRDEAWESDFLRTFVTSDLYLIGDNVQMGPDGWPYLYLTEDNSQKHVSEDKASNLIQWAYEHGVGLVLNGHKERPDYVFHYGLIWNFIHNKFFTNSIVAETPPNAPIYISKVSEDILPQHAMNFVKDYIKSAGIDQPRGALISRDKINYDFALAIESLGNPPKSEHEGIAKGIGWFMPHHIPVVLIYEDKLQKLYDL